MKAYEQVASSGKRGKKVNNDIELSLMVNSSKMKLTINGQKVDQGGFLYI